VPDPVTSESIASYPSRRMEVGSLAVSRALPVKDRRMVGPWCFLDRYGPLTFTEGRPMDVAPHPHIGLQTVTWLIDGEVAHDDSLGCEAVARPGGVSVMTAGRGIAHAERTPAAHTGRLSGVQLWTALPDGERHRAPSFQHVEQVPVVELRGGIVRLFAGELAEARSPARHFSGIVGADLEAHAGERLVVPLQRSFEHAFFVLSGACVFDRQPLHEGVLYYLSPGRFEAAFDSPHGCRVLLIGGPPFLETVLMWWNFVARTPEEMLRARTDWEEHRRFGDVVAYDGPRLQAPSLARLARPNPLS
jgi:quercetin 2,3-dioxygenase